VSNVIKKILEFKTYSEIDDDELLEMSNISSKRTGIDNVVIWLGPNPHSHGKRIKVSNVPNKGSRNCFTVTIPELEVIGEINKSFIDSKKLDQIKEFIKINLDVICRYSDQEITTDEMFDDLKKI